MEGLVDFKILILQGGSIRGIRNFCRGAGCRNPTRFQVDLGPTLGGLWANSGPILAPTLALLWADFGPTLGRLCADFGHTPGPNADPKISWPEDFLF